MTEEDTGIVAVSLSEVITAILFALLICLVLSILLNKKFSVQINQQSIQIANLSKTKDSLACAISIADSMSKSKEKELKLVYAKLDSLRRKESKTKYCYRCPELNVPEHISTISILGENMFWVDYDTLSFALLKNKYNEVLTKAKQNKCRLKAEVIRFTNDYEAFYKAENKLKKLFIPIRIN